MKEKRGIQSMPQSIRILTSIVAFAVLFAICLSLFRLVEQNEQANERHLQELESVLEKTQEKAESQLTSLYQMGASVHGNSILRKVALRDYTVVDAMNALEQMRSQLFSNPLLLYSYYYVHQTQCLFGNEEIIHLSEEKLLTLPYDEYDGQQLMSLLQSVKSGDGLRLLSSRRSINSGSANVIIAILPIPVNSTLTYATLVMEINETKLLHTIMPSGKGSGILFTFYQNGEPIFASSGTAARLEALGVMENGRALYQADGQEYHLFQTDQSGSRIGLSCRMYVPSSEMTAGLLSTAQVWMISGGCITLLLLLCPILYVWTYQPMRLLLEKLSQDEPASRLVRSDYAIVLQEIERLRTNNTSMLREIGMSMNRVRASLIRSLLEYETMPDHFGLLCERAGIRFRYPHFRLVLSASRDPGARVDLDECFYLLTGDVMDVYAVREPDMFYLLVNSPVPQIASTSLVAEQLERVNVMGPADQLFFARSVWTDDLAQLHTQYRKTLDRLAQNIFHGAIGLTEEPEPFHEQEPATQSYPINEIMLLRESAMDFDQEKMKEAMRQIQQFLLHEGTQNTVALLAAADALQILQRHTQADMGVLLERVRRRDATAVEVCQALRESLELIGRTTERSSADTLTEEMMLYISERLEDANLSSMTVSEHFGMSESAFSHAFKKRTGRTFTKYVTDLKIQRAKSLLICTDLSVEAIADRLNYASASSFARMFKAETALTPTQYRKLSVNGENN